MKNTVIANRKKTDWPIIKNYFESRGVDTSKKSGKFYEESEYYFMGHRSIYYGVINDWFHYFPLNEVQQANATILEVGDITDTVTLPKSFVIEAHRSACKDWKKRIEEVVPELFPKNELIVGKWYKKGDAISMFNGVGEYSYGIHSNGSWMDVHFWFGCSKSIERWQPATEEEVFKALKKEAVRRGVKEGVKVKSTFDGNQYTLNNYSFTFNRDGKNTMAFGGVQIFNNGKWATIIEPALPKSLQKAIDEIGKEEILKLLKN